MFKGKTIECPDETTAHTKAKELSQVDRSATVIRYSPGKIGYTAVAKYRGGVKI
jgi:hypothetical protein